MNSLRTFTKLALTATFMTAGLAQVSAQETYPNKPVELVCSTSPGSTAAQWCQMLAQVLSQKDALGVPVNVAFKGAGSGNEAGVYVAGRDNDGYTILHANASWSGYMNLPTFERSVDDFEFLARIEKFIYALGTHSQQPYQTFDDVVAAAKEKPGTIAVAGNKIGSIHHKHILSVFSAADAEAVHIPYEGSGDAVRDVLGQHVPVGLGSIGQLQPHVEAGTIRPLVVLNEERVAAFPDVPTPAELGYDYPISHQWQGIFMKAGTPEEVKDKIRAALTMVVESPEYAEYLKNSPHVEKNFETDGAALKSSFEAELEDYQEFMKANGIL
ncbi:tripartite tricarboxylate transporter substrate binding protein [Aureimonas fodinaquatilis]|uniref:Tripartite tricarboxylate transporter substrate binding protein n=1 Tax=Aureimonas fodinaquatilis TaxID=2565783 RepID=A0A5B0DS01_9HYPH|nr:tripartite tricarboxylate transporter substrate binding protein [Aureimonas fodinaquatilis]KAA0969584.1 tripartite tricarboxylate transporter substrate binding protein [Aureimonas fodinaquatilis]